jgi:hypothetical protein
MHYDNGGGGEEGDEDEERAHFMVWTVIYNSGLMGGPSEAFDWY